MERSLSRSLPYLPRYQSLSPARSPCLGGRRFASLRSVSSPSQQQRICYIDAGEATRMVSTSYRTRTSPSPKRSFKVHLFGPGVGADGKKRVHHATRVTRSLSAHDLYSSHVYTSQDDLISVAAHQADARRAYTSCQDLYHKGPFHPDATTASESGVSMGGISDESLSLYGADDVDNLSQHSFGSSSAFHEITFDSEHDRCDSSDAYFSGAEGGYGPHHGDRLLDVLYEDHPDAQSSPARRRRQNVSSPLSYSENRRRELQLPPNGQEKTQAKFQALRVLIPGTDVPLRSGATAAGTKDHSKSPGDKRVLTSTPLAQSTPHVSPRGQGEAKLSILASWNADDSLEDQCYDDRTNARDVKLAQKSQVARILFDSDISDLKDVSSCNSSQSEDNFSDVSSATLGSYTARRTKLVKRASDKQASAKHSAHPDTSQTDQPKKGSQDEYEPDLMNSGKGKQESRAPGSKAECAAAVDSVGRRADDSGNEDGGSESNSLVSDNWEDRQTFHEMNARAASTVYGGTDEGEGEDKGEEGDGEGEDEDECAPPGRKMRTSTKSGRVKGARHVPSSSGILGESECYQGTSGSDTVSSAKVNIPLISAGKHGQEKLRMRLSQSSPPPSALSSPGTPPSSPTGPSENASGQGQASHPLIDSDTMRDKVSDSIIEICVDDSGGRQENGEEGVKKLAEGQDLNSNKGLECSQNNTKMIYDKAPEHEADEERADKDIIRFCAVETDALKPNGDGQEKTNVLNTKANSDSELFTNRGRDLSTRSTATTAKVASSSIDTPSDALWRSQCYERNAGPDEVRETPTVTAGHFANTAHNSDDEGGTGAATVGAYHAEGEGEGDRGRPHSDGRYLIAQVGEGGERGALPESGEREGGVKNGAQVSGEGGECGVVVGERLRSEFSSTLSTTVTSSAPLVIGNLSPEAESSSGSSSVGCCSEQSHLLDLDLGATGKSSSLTFTAEEASGKSFIDSEGIILAGNVNKARTSGEATTDVFSDRSDCFKSESKLTLLLTPVSGHEGIKSDRNINITHLATEPGPNLSDSPHSSPNSTDAAERENKEEKEKEKEKLDFLANNSSGAEENQDLCVIGETRGMERPIDPPGSPLAARAASERETPQTVLVRVTATAQNLERGRTAARQARDKDQQQRHITEFPLPQQHQVSDRLLSSGYKNNSFSPHHSVNGLLDLDSQHNYTPSVESCSWESNNSNNNFEQLIGTPVNEEDSNYKINTSFCEQEKISEGQGKNRNIPWQADRESIQAQTSGRGDQNKGSRPFSDDKVAVFMSDTQFVTGVGECIVQKKQVEVTEVCHKVVKKIRNTIVEESNVSSKDCRFSNHSPLEVNGKDIITTNGDLTKDKSSKTTTVEDVEDTVTTKTTTTTFVLDPVSPEFTRKEDLSSNVFDTGNNQVCTTNVNLREDASEKTSSFRPAGRDDTSVNFTTRGAGENQSGRCPSLQTSTCENVLPAAPSPCGLVVGQTAVPNAHVMREVTHTWQARPDPGVKGCPVSPKSTTPASPSPAAVPSGVDLYPLKRNGDDNYYTASRLDNLQAKLAQISTQSEATHRSPSSPASHLLHTTHGSPASSASSASPPYQDHAEATSVLKQIVRGDTDGLNGFSQFSTGPGDYDSVSENGAQVHRRTGPTYYSYWIEFRDDPAGESRANNTPENGDERPERERYDNDYDNAPSITTDLPSRPHYNNHYHHHHHLQLLKPGQLKASSLWTLQEETESLLEAVSPKPVRRTLTSLASDDEDTNSVTTDQDTVLSAHLAANQNTHSTNDAELEVNQANLSNNSVEQDLSDTAIGHKNCASESSDFDDSDGNYSSISTAESTSYRSSSYGREQTPLSDETEFIPPLRDSKAMDYRRAQGSSVDRVSSFNDFVSGLQESLASPYTVHGSQRGNLAAQLQHSERLSTLDSLTESLKQFSELSTEPETFPDLAPLELSTHEGENSLSFHSIDTDHFNSSYQHQHSPRHRAKDSNHNTSLTSTSTVSHYSWATAPSEDSFSEASWRLHALDLDLSRISSCGSPAPSDLSDASSAYTCTGTAQIKRQQFHVSFGEAPTAAALLSPSTRGTLHSSTPKSKAKLVPIIKRPPSPREELRRKYVDENVRQFDQILKDFHKRINPASDIDGVQIIEAKQTEVLSDKTSNANISNYDDLYKAFTNDDTEKKQNNVCIVLEDENMNSFRFKRFLRKSHTKRRKGKKVMRFLNRLSCVSEGMASPQLDPLRKASHGNTKEKITSSLDQDVQVQTFSTDSMPSPSSPGSKFRIPKPQLKSTSSFQHHHRQLETPPPPVNVSSSSTLLSTPPQSSPASSTQSVGSSRSRADSAYSSVSESLSHGSSGSSPRRLTTSSSSSRAGVVLSSTGGDRSLSADSAYSTGPDAAVSRTPSELDQTLLASSSSKEDTEDMLSALSDVFEQLDVCEGEIDRALLNRMKYGHTRTRPARRF